MFSQPAQFEARATSFLAEGASRHELLMLVADDPNVAQWPAHLMARGQLVIASTREVYGDGHTVDAAAQRATFEELLADAIEQGYTGIRVVADNSSLIVGPDRLAAWMEWEDVADAFMAEHPVTGLCAFDRSRIDPETIDQMVLVHSHTLDG